MLDTIINLAITIITIRNIIVLMIIQLAIIIRIKKNMITFITTEIIKLTI